jgi:GH35 family endo-1,4-beta-xylanase
MNTLRLTGLCACLLGLALTARPAHGVTASALPVVTNGQTIRGSRTLVDNGYLGTYLQVAEAGPVTITVQASGAASGGVAPRMNIVVADQSAGFDVGPTAGTYQHTFTLSAGTHFVRTELNNDPLKTSRALTVDSLDVAGATLANVNSNANALAAADTYIANYRRGATRLDLVGVAPGAPVRVELKKHAFRFGTAVGGFTQSSVNTYLNNANYSNFLRANFNTLSMGNAGKWATNEATRDVVSMSGVDRIYSYADQYGMDVRAHNLLWGDSQQPNWAVTLADNAAAGDAAAKADLRGEISERIAYYVRDRARRYEELDVLNEHSHQPKYWNVYGTAGIADIFNETAQAVAAAGAQTRLYLNEYNVLAWGDNYANWYREDVEKLTVAGGAIGGIGVQYYPSSIGGSQGHSPARMMQTFQNLSVTGLPLSLTEFGVGTNNGATTPEQAATMLNETMRMVFGTPGATTFTMWGFWANDVWSQAPLAALMDANWNLTAPGVAYLQLMNQWDTDLNLVAGADGSVDFTGYYGDYEVTVGGKRYALSLTKDGGPQQLVVALAADFNNDGKVDFADLASWQTRFAQGLASADGFLRWQQELGLVRTAPLAEPAAANVPEPPGLGLLIAAAACQALRRRYRAFAAP